MDVITGLFQKKSFLKVILEFLPTGTGFQGAPGGENPFTQGGFGPGGDPFDVFSRISFFRFDF